MGMIGRFDLHTYVHSDFQRIHHTSCSLKPSLLQAFNEACEALCKEAGGLKDLFEVRSFYVEICLGTLEDFATCKASPPW